MIKSFLKWPGGKSRVCSKINEILPSGNRLIEPFVGGGSVFLNTNFEEYLLGDANPDIINLYNIIKYDDSFIEFAKQYFTPEYNTTEEYNKLRDIFNTSDDIHLKSALFIYLNKHCFNGLCRYNKKGVFNVPCGKYNNPKFPETELRYFIEKSKKATFIVSDFRDIMKKAVPGDVVYCDPPYVDGFTDYTANGFSMEDQKDLSTLAIELSNKGLPVLISNHSTELTLELYKSSKITEIDVQRSISSKGDGRIKAKELLAFFDGKIYD